MDNDRSGRFNQEVGVRFVERVGGWASPRTNFGRFGENKNPFILTGIQTQVRQHITSSEVAIYIKFKILLFITIIN
jgi:hypothetical protein